MRRNDTYSYSSKSYDFIVIDTPPTGVSLRTLYLPVIYGVWVNKLIEIRERIVSLRYSITRALCRQAEVRDRVLDKLHEIKREYQGLYSNLRDNTRTSYILVTTPEPLPVYELKESLRFLKERLNSNPRLLVLNRYLPENVAARLGILETQRRYIEELKGLNLPLIIIEYLGRPTSTLRDIYELMSKVRSA